MFSYFCCLFSTRRSGCSLSGMVVAKPLDLTRRGARAGGTGGREQDVRRGRFRQNLLGKRGMGFVITIKTFDQTRPGVGAQAHGLLDQFRRESQDATLQQREQSPEFVLAQHQVGKAAGRYRGAGARH